MPLENDNSRKKNWTTKIPFIRSFLEISSDYVCEGSSVYFEKIAPIKFWLRTLGWPVLLSMILSLIPYPCGCMPYSFDIVAQPHDVALALVPSLLGFGIGAYALVFGLNSDLLKNIQTEHNKKEIETKMPTASVLSINSAFAFPLISMATTTVVATIQKILPDIQILSSITWFLTFLCLTLTYQLIVALYRLGRVIILDKF